MSTDAPPTFLARLARRPLPILLGVAVGFLSCCIAGRVAARQQPIQDFTRFHVGITLHSLYYPTYSQTLNLAREHVKPGKTLVIIAGSSVVSGVGQRREHVWSGHLQQLLGDDYVVLNLALPAGSTEEYAGPIAEQLLADGVPVVVICAGTIGQWDGLTYRYAFWDAWGKGLIQPDPRRDSWLAEFGTQYAKDEKRLELRRAGLVDGATYSHDLWNYVAYRYCATVWNPLKYPNVWETYRLSKDTDPGATLPFELCNNPSWDDRILPIIRGSTAKYHAMEARGDLAFSHLHTVSLPDRLRDRSIHLIHVVGTYYRARVTPAERADYEAMSRRYRDALVRLGLPAHLIGENFAETDYSDAFHLSESGGRKLAEELAPRIRQMNEQLYGKPTVKGAKP
jgi:lysophospholipase L1-like esterase